MLPWHNRVGLEGITSVDSSSTDITSMCSLYYTKIIFFLDRNASTACFCTRNETDQQHLHFLSRKDFFDELGRNVALFWVIFLKLLVYNN